VLRDILLAPGEHPRVRLLEEYRLNIIEYMRTEKNVAMNEIQWYFKPGQEFIVFTEDLTMPGHFHIFGTKGENPPGVFHHYEFALVRPDEENFTLVLPKSIDFETEMS